MLGYGKRTSMDLYRIQSRGGRGVTNFKVTAKTGPVIGAMPVRVDDALILLTSTNKIMRMSVEEIRSAGRATMGVRLVRLDDGAKVVGFDTVDERQVDRLEEAEQVHPECALIEESGDSVPVELGEADGEEDSTREEE